MWIDQTIQDVARDEGFRAKVYKCTANKWTIGYGRNVEDRGVTRDEADVMLRNDIMMAIKELRAAFEWFEDLPQPAKRGLVNMHVNLGLPRLRGFRRMLAALEGYKFEKAAQEALESKWAHQVGQRAHRIASLYREAALW